MVSTVKNITIKHQASDDLLFWDQSFLINSEAWKKNRSQNLGKHISRWLLSQRQKNIWFEWIDFPDRKIITSSLATVSGGNNSDIPRWKIVIWSRVNAIKLLPDRFSFSWPGTKVRCIIPERDMRGIWSSNCDTNKHSSKLRKCHNLSIICLSNTQLSPNLLRQRGFVIITMQTEVSWIKKSSTAADNV